MYIPNLIIERVKKMDNNFNEILDSSVESICEYLKDKYGISAIPGKISICHVCGRKKAYVTKDDRLVKCFHNLCGAHIHVSKTSADYKTIIWEILDQICLDSHQALLNQEKEMSENNAWSFLVVKRKIDPMVIDYSMIGVIPENIDYRGLVDQGLNQLQKMKAKAKNRAMEDLIQAEIESVSEKLDKLENILKNNIGWITFFHTDENMKITGIKFRNPVKKEFRSWTAGKNHGVFGLGLLDFCIGESLPNLDIVEGEINSLQLQSLNLRVNHDGAAEPKFLNIVSVGSALGADFETIAKLCMTPTIIYDNDDAGQSVVADAREHVHPFVITTPEPYNDLDDYIISFGADYKLAWESWIKLLTEKKRLFRYFEPLEKIVMKINCVPRVVLVPAHFHPLGCPAGHEV